MTDAAKAAVWDAQWLPWGGVHAITGSAVMDARFPGQWFQSETGLHYNWHRSYDASIGRYTQPDPLGFVDGPSIYAYAQSSPQKLVDRDGRATQSLAGPAFGAGTIVCGPVCGGIAAGAVIIGGQIAYQCLRERISKRKCRDLYEQCVMQDWPAFVPDWDSSMRCQDCYRYCETQKS